jgi:two-component system, NtrC family, nitrogen regulation sensor histidine kinase NtrY
MSILACCLAILFIALSAIIYIKNIGIASHRHPDPKSFIFLLMTDLIILFFLIIVISKIKISEKWGGVLIFGKSKLQAKIIARFCAVAIIPTLIITTFSSLFFNYGVQSWFNEKINTAFKESVEISHAYIQDHISLIQSDASGIAYNLNNLHEVLSNENDHFNNYLSKIFEDRSLIEAVVFEINPLKIIAQAQDSVTLNLQALPDQALLQAKDKIVVIREDNKVQALIKLKNFPQETYLLVARFINPSVVLHEKKIKQSYNDYKVLKNNIYSMQWQFLISFLIVSLIIVIAAIWSGVVFTSKIVSPILNLVKATEKIKQGDYNIDIKNITTDDEISVLVSAFNKMTSQLSIQRQNLIDANKEIDTKRHFSETILSNISAGVIALDVNKNITMINPQALLILDLKKSDVYGNNISDYVAEFKELIVRLDETNDKTFSTQLTLIRKTKTIMLFIRVTNEFFNKKILGCVITFEDITELVLAQRSAAWSDIARRIAHEIKNPLTPIHLAAQRLNKKYKHQVTDGVMFSKYTDTIVKHVNQVGKIVEEFIYFARMPSPIFSYHNLCTIIQDVVFARECQDNKILYKFNHPANEVLIRCDNEQITQVLTNLIKNAEEAILTSYEPIIDPLIYVSLKISDDFITINIVDNGPGISGDLFSRITEPYVTNKTTGTGLGLAIVKKIIDDHDANIEFVNQESGGTKISINLKKNNEKKEKNEILDER